MMHRLGQHHEWSEFSRHGSAGSDYDLGGGVALRQAELRKRFTVGVDVNGATWSPTHNSAPEPTISSSASLASDWSPPFSDAGKSSGDKR